MYSEFRKAYSSSILFSILKLHTNKYFNKNPFPYHDIVYVRSMLDSNNPHIIDFSLLRNNYVWTSLKSFIYINNIEFTQTH